MLQHIIFLFAALWSLCATAASTVVVSNRPLHSLASAVLAGITTPELLLADSQSVHQVQIKPSQAQRVKSAARVYWFGSEVEPFLTALSGPDWRDTLADDSVQRLPQRTWDELERSADTAIDPHLWLSPANGLALVSVLERDALSLFPEQSARIRDNAAATRARITALDRRIATQLAMLPRRGFAVSHDAYQYFEASYGLASQAVLSRDPHAGTSAFRVRLMAEAIQRAEVACLFSEPALSSRVLDRLQSQYQIPVILLDPMGWSYPPGPDLYIQTLEGIHQGFVHCFQTEKP